MYLFVSLISAHKGAVAYVFFCPHYVYYLSDKTDNFQKYRIAVLYFSWIVLQYNIKLNC